MQSNNSTNRMVNNHCKNLHAVFASHECLPVAEHRDVEFFTVSLLKDFLKTGSAKIRTTNTFVWTNCHLDQDKILRRQSFSVGESCPIMREISYNRQNSKHRFALFLYVLAEIHKKLLHGGKCTSRELYYNNITLTRNQAYVDAAIRDMSIVFQRPHWELGVLASGKGLVAGDLSFVMKNGDIIECISYDTPTLIPTNFLNVERLKTNASLVLLVEKDTVFEKLISDLLRGSNADIILVTGKGFPDICTRILVHRLCYECRLPIYTLMDADPFGVEIMLVYRHGSRALAHYAQQLACPELHWVGIHPSEINMMNIHTEPLKQRDRKKIQELLKRHYLEVSVRKELIIMQHLQRKAEVENVSCFSLSFLLKDYIPNKIKRNLLL